MLYKAALILSIVDVTVRNSSVSIIAINILYGSTEYRDHEGLGFLAPKYHPKPSLICDLVGLIAFTVL